MGVLGYVFLSRGSQDSVQNGGTKTTTMEEGSSSDTFVGSLKEAIGMGVAMKCTYEVEGNEYEGYIKGKNYRGKMVNAEGQTGEVIVKENCMWSWSENQAQGVKTCIADEDMEEEGGDIWDQPDTVDTSVNYKCLPTTVSDSMFTPPSDIQFLDIDEMMKNFGVEGNTQQ